MSEHKKPHAGPSWPVVAAVLAIPMLLGMWFGQRWLERWLPDAEGTYAAAWLRTRDVAPGDEVAIRVAPRAGATLAIVGLHAKIGDIKIEVPGYWYSGGELADRDRKSTAEFRILVPSSSPLDREVTIELSIAMVVAAPGGGGTYREQDWTDTITVPVAMRSPGARTTRKLIDGGIALGAWLLVSVLAYALTRWGLARTLHAMGKSSRRPTAGASDAELTGQVAFGGIAIIVVSAMLAMAGQLVFVRPILRTTTMQSEVFIVSLLAIWAFALVIGGVLGMRASRSDARWSRARMRAVIGNPPLSTAFREPASVLPAGLSREAERQSADRVRRAIEQAGFAATVRGQRVEITTQGRPAARVKARRAAPWIPEDLLLEVNDGVDLTPLMVDLANLFGPIEYAAPQGAPVIVDPVS